MARKENRKEEGFSLVELLVVIVIIGILAAIAIPLYNNQRSRAYQATAEYDGRNLSLEISSMLSRATDMGTSPASNTSWVAWDPETSELTLSFDGSPIGVSEVTTVRLTAGTNISTSGYEGGPVGAFGPVWCVAVENSGELAVYTEAGLQAGATQCSSDGFAS